jgi:hypothetical protein
MSPITALKLFTLPVVALLSISVLSSLVNRPFPRKWRAVLAFGGLAFFIARWFWLHLVNEDVSTAIDFHLFWNVGRAFLAGEDVYSPATQATLSQPMIYPPTTPPLLSVFGVFPEKWAFLIFQVLNLAILISIGPLAWKSIRQGSDTSVPESKHLDSIDVMTLGLMLALSPALDAIFFLGQMALIITACIVAALYAQSAGRPVLAGVLLAIAAIKPTVTAPFLLLFFNRSDRLTWIALILGSLLLIELSGGLVKLPSQFENISENAKGLWAPGGLNDYTFANMSDHSAEETRLGFDHFFYRLGLRDTAQIGVLNNVAVAIVVLLIGLLVLKYRTSRPACCALLALGSMLFFYHRIHDGGILMLPILYAADKLRTGPKRSRIWYAIALLSCFALLYTPGRPIKYFLFRSFEIGGWKSWLIQATLICWPMWSLLIALGALVKAEFIRQNGTASDKLG